MHILENLALLSVFDILSRRANELSNKHNGSKSQIWDRRSSQKYNCLYYFCLQTHQKTNGINGKVVSQVFILALTKNTFSSLTPSKLGKTPFFRAFLWIFQTGVLFFWLKLQIIPICHLEA